MTAYLMPAIQIMNSNFYPLSSNQYDFNFTLETTSLVGPICGEGSEGINHIPATIHVHDGQIVIVIAGTCSLSGTIDDNGDFTMDLGGVNCPGIQDNGCNQQTGPDSCCSRTSSSVDITGHFDGNSLTNGAVHSVAVVNTNDPDCVGHTGTCVADSVISAEKI